MFGMRIVAIIIDEKIVRQLRYHFIKERYKLSGLYLPVDRALLLCS